MLVIAVVIGAALLYCLWRFWRGAWWADGVMSGIAGPSMIAFAALGGVVGIVLAAGAGALFLLGAASYSRYA